MKKTKYTFLWGNTHFHSTVDMNLQGLKLRRDNIWNRVNNVFEISRNYKIFTYHNKKDIGADRERGKNYLDDDYVKKHIADMEEACHKHKKFFEKLSKAKYKKLGNEELYKLVEESSFRWQDSMSYFRATQQAPTHYLFKKLQDKYSDEEVSLLSMPRKPDQAKIEEREWYVLVKKPYSKKSILKHVMKHPWIVSTHVSMADVYETLKQRYNFDKKRRQHVSHDKDMIRKQEALIRKHPELRKYVELIQRLGLSRMEIKAYWTGTDFYTIWVFEEIAKRTGESFKDLRNMYMLDDVRKLIFDNKRISTQEKKHRVQCLVGFWNDGKLRYVSGDKAETLAKKELGSLYKVENRDELKGVVANPGNIKGMAIILHANNVPQMREVRRNFKKGEILITEMTQPNIMDIASKAGAIVTDEGGMLSHAAIISREMNIPCIVGTGVATRIIKDGDYIEVDADKGIVRRISKSEYEALKKKNVSKPKVKKMTKAKTKEYHFRPDHISWFKDVKKEDIPLVGGKGANLGEMFHHFNIPNGFCITVNAYKLFMDETGIGAHIHGLLDKLDVEGTEELDKISKEIRDLILKQKFPEGIKKEILSNYKKLKNKKVAVRSSATAEDLPTASFAGQQDTYLNIEGKKNVIESVQKCWASLFTSRAIYYRERNNFHHRDVLICVVIQKMIDAKHAGVMFTVDPIHKKYVLVEMVEGLGEALVSGQVTPNTYFINKKEHKISEASEHFDLDHKLVEQVSKLGEKIEAHYKFPQDVEFAYDEEEELFILQSRPITTL